MEHSEYMFGYVGMLLPNCDQIGLESFTKESVSIVLLAKAPNLGLMLLSDFNKGFMVQHQSLHKKKRRC